MCSKAPKPDPLIGQAAKSNAELAKEQAAVAREQLAWEKERAEKQDPMLEKIVNQQIETGDKNMARADEQWNMYRDLFAPVEERMVKDANEFDSEERKSRMAAEAGGDVSRGYDAAREQNERAMGRMGVNPNSGRYQALAHETGLGLAKDSAGAMNAARRATELQGMAMREGVAKFGRGMTSTGLAADSAAIGAGNAASGNIAGQSQIRNQNMNAAQSWFGGAGAANSSAAGIMNTQHQNQLTGWAQEQQNLMGAMQGIGSLVGSVGSAGSGTGFGKLFGFRKGGLVRGNRGYRRPYNMGLSGKGYAAGGMIEGPGTGTSDSIPGSIEGVQPVRLSNGEAVLNREAVELVGEEFVHRINSGGLAMGSVRTGREG